jgi:hypothetical protein
VIVGDTRRRIAKTPPPSSRFRQTGHVSATDGLDRITDRLYALPPTEFIAARDAEAQAARDAGDRDTAAAIGKLRRPTVGAWMVNLLARQRPDLVDELFALGADMRAAQRELRGPELRELTAKRRAAVGGLVRAAVALAEAAGAKASTLPVGEVETTLTAALADAEIADVVRAGRLLKAGTYDGFGEAPRPGLRVVPPPAPEPEPEPEPITVDEPGPDATVRLEEATADLAAAEAAYAEAAADVAARTREIAEIEARLEALREERRGAHAAVLAAQAESTAAEAAVHAARRRHAAAVRAAKRSG